MARTFIGLDSPCPEIPWSVRTTTKREVELSTQVSTSVIFSRGGEAIVETGSSANSAAAPAAPSGRRRNLRRLRENDLLGDSRGSDTVHLGCPDSNPVAPDGKCV